MHIKLAYHTIALLPTLTPGLLLRATATCAYALDIAGEVVVVLHAGISFSIQVNNQICYRPSGHERIGGSGELWRMRERNSHLLVARVEHPVKDTTSRPRRRAVDAHCAAERALLLLERAFA
jgi:hypothetical protein